MEELERWGRTGGPGRGGVDPRDRKGNGFRRSQDEEHRDEGVGRGRRSNQRRQGMGLEPQAAARGRGRFAVRVVAVAAARRDGSGHGAVDGVVGRGGPVDEKSRPQNEGEEPPV